MEDKAAMQAMFQLAKVHTKSCGVGTLAPWKCAGVGVGLMLWGRMCGVAGWAPVLATPPCCECDRCPLSPQSEDRSVLYAVASTLVNCTNSYDHEEPDPQMLELAKYAKQHIPEQHPKVSTGHGCAWEESGWVGHRLGPQVWAECP